MPFGDISFEDFLKLIKIIEEVKTAVKQSYNRKATRIIYDHFPNFLINFWNVLFKRECAEIYIEEGIKLIDEQNISLLKEIIKFNYQNNFIDGDHLLHIFLKYKKLNKETLIAIINCYSFTYTELSKCIDLTNFQHVLEEIFPAYEIMIKIKDGKLSDEDIVILNKVELTQTDIYDTIKLCVETPPNKDTNFILKCLNRKLAQISANEKDDIIPTETSSLNNDIIPTKTPSSPPPLNDDEEDAVIV